MGLPADLRKAVMNSYIIGQKVFDKEISVLQNVRAQLGKTFDLFLDEIMQCKGKVILIGMGKSGHVARKIAATMSSLGTCAISLHPGECMHGDLGMIQKQDLVILISYSGESDEILRIIPGINMIGSVILGITCNGDSTLSRSCKVVQVLDNVEEACHLGLAPTSSTTAVMVYGDALAVTASQLKGFDKEEFGRFHPAGSLGKKLITRAVDLMHPIQSSSVVLLNSSIFDVIQIMLDINMDIVMVVNNNNELIGVITNNDIKKAVLNNLDIKTISIDSVVHYYPYFVDDSAMAVDALTLMQEKKVPSTPVVKNNRPIGVLTKKDILRYGIYI